MLRQDLLRNGRALPNCDWHCFFRKGRNMLQMNEMKIRVKFLEELLGTASNDPNIHSEFIASKAPDAKTREEEVAAIGVDEVVEKQKTVFPRGEDGQPYMWDYQIRGFFKGSASALHKIKGTKTSKLKAYKKEVDLRIFIKERKVPISFDGEIGSCQRPLRAQTMQGERISLANSESIPAGSTMEFTIQCLNEEDMDLVREWLDYGRYNGMGQWRNSGKGRFEWEEIAS